MPFDQFIEDERPGARRFRDILARERRDMAWLVYVVACLYDEVSGGRISKPMTYPSEVIAAFNERLERAEAIDEDRLARALEATYDELYAFTRTAPSDEDTASLAADIAKAYREDTNAEHR